jgi:nucleotide-binding universal stress UspA family protein
VARTLFIYVSAFNYIWGLRLFKKLISAVDGSFHSELASDYAIAISSSCKSELVVIAVDNGEVEKEVLSNAVDRVCQHARKDGIHARGVVRKGPTVETILDMVKAESADLLVVATRHSGNRLFVRSISQQLMFKAPCSVIMVKPTGLTRKGKNMLLPIAHREMAVDERIALSGSLAQFYNYKIEILHVVERQRWYDLPWAKLDTIRRHAEENMIPVVKRLIELGVDADVHAVIASSATSAILKEVAIGKHSVVLLGASQRGILKQVVSGNPIEEMLSKLFCDVLVWRPGK